MLFRFWGQGAKSTDARADEGASPHHPGVLALIEDAVASKRGVFCSAQDQLYVCGLKQPADALVVSRQVQLGLQGFRGANAAGPVAVSIAIDASGVAIEAKPDADKGGDPASPDSCASQSAEPPHDLVTLLKLSKPAQVLLTHDLCQQLAAIKGLPLKSFPGRFGVYEYLWTGEEKLDLLQSEPQLTLAALPAAKDRAAPAADMRTAEPAPSRTDMVTEKRRALRVVWLQSPRVLIGAAAAAVVLAAAIVIGLHSARRPPSGAAPIQTPQSSPAQTSTPAAVTPPAPVQSPTPEPVEKPHGTASRQANKTVTHQAAQADEKRATPAKGTAPEPAANCTLGANPERFVVLAEQDRGRGDYANAIRIFREVLNCDPDNAAAREGLDKATRGEQSQH